MRLDHVPSLLLMTIPTPMRPVTTSPALLLLLLCLLAEGVVRGSSAAMAAFAPPPILVPTTTHSAARRIDRSLRRPVSRAAATTTEALEGDLETEERRVASASQPTARFGSRRHAVHWMISQAVATAATTALFNPALAMAAESKLKDKIPDRMDVDNFLRTGMVANPMGVSGQAGKSRPETGVLLREGTDVRRDAKTGDVLAELLLKSSSSSSSELTPVVATFQSPWPLATGTVFDVECRDPRTGDGVFLQVTPPLPPSATSAAALSEAFVVDQLVSPTGRFSFYGAPTDVRVRATSNAGDNLKVFDVTFSIMSQSTQTELPRQARIVATVPSGAAQAVLLVASTGALRWKKVEPQVAQVVQSFRAVPAPPTQLKVRAKERR